MNITCYDIDGNLLKTLTQWDINQQIVIKNLVLTNTPEVHFCNSNSKLALIGESTYADGVLTTEVPNILLQESLPIVIYIYVPKGDGSAKTTYSIRIPINPRVKPADYEYSDNAQFITYQELQEALEKSVEVIELANAAADHANETAALAEESMEYGKSNFANAIKGTAHADYGEYIYIDDVSPIEHEMEVLLTQKNIFDISKVTIESDTAIARVSEVGDDYIIVTTPDGYTSNGYCDRPTITLRELCPCLEINKTYILNADTESEIKQIYLRPTEVSWKFGETKTITEEMLDSKVAFYGLSVLNGQATGNCKISNIQVEEGETVTDYVPYVDLSTVSVNACGKNLFNGELLTGIFSDNIFNMNNTTNKVWQSIKIYLQAGTYTISFDTAVNIVREILDGVWSITTPTNIKTYTFEITNDGYVGFTFRDTTSSTTEWDETSPIQIERGDTCTEYESYRGHTATADIYGVVDGLHSTSPDMWIYADSNEVDIDVEYNIDSMQTQADMAENDPESPHYIKNRTHYEETVETDYRILQNAGNGVVSTVSPALGLVVGNTYQVDALLDGVVISTFEIIATNPYAEGDTSYPEYVNGLIEESTGSLVGDNCAVAENGTLIEADSCTYQINLSTSSCDSIKIHGVKDVSTVVHKLDNKYLNIDQEFDDSSENAQSGIAIYEYLDDSVYPYLDKTAFAGIYEHTVSSEVASVTINSLINDDRAVAMQCTRLCIHLQIPVQSINSSSNILIQARPNGTNIYNDLVPRNSSVMRLPTEYSAGYTCVDVFLKTLSNETYLVLYGAAYSESSYGQNGYLDIPLHSLVYSSYLGNYDVKRINLLKISLSNNNLLPVGTTIKVYGVNAA